MQSLACKNFNGELVVKLASFFVICFVLLFVGPTVHKRF